MLMIPVWQYVKRTFAEVDTYQKDLPGSDDLTRCVMEPNNRYAFKVNLYTDRYSLNIMIPHDFFRNKLTPYPYMHIHAGYEVIMVRDEQCAGHNRFMVIPPLTKHVSFHAHNSHSVFAVSFLFNFEPLEKPLPANLKGNTVLEAFLSLSKPITIRDSFKGVDHIFAVWHELEHKLHGYNEKITAELLLLLIDLARRLPVVAPAEPPETRQTIHENQLYLIDCFFAWDYGSPDCSKKELAALLGVSERQLTRILDAQYNSTFRSLLLQTRMEIARSIHRMTGFSAEHVCERVGYRSVSSFLASYHRYFGCPYRSDG